MCTETCIHTRHVQSHTVDWENFVDQTKPWKFNISHKFDFNMKFIDGYNRDKCLEHHVKICMLSCLAHVKPTLPCLITRWSGLRSTHSDIQSLLSQLWYTEPCTWAFPIFYYTLFSKPLPLAPWMCGGIRRARYHALAVVVDRTFYLR